MFGRLGRRDWIPVALTVAFYVAVLLVAPSQHHDFACHQDSRTHCTSCISSQTAPSVSVSAVPIGEMAVLAGEVVARVGAIVQIIALLSDSGRSPPA